jgi:hypothetical protein
VTAPEQVHDLLSVARLFDLALAVLLVAAVHPARSCSWG